jgi:hypothetical protein
MSFAIAGMCAIYAHGKPTGVTHEQARNQPDHRPGASERGP